MKNVLWILLVLQQSVLAADFKPKDGFVPTKEVAVKIAEAVLVPIYGKQVLKEKPWKVSLNGDKWFIEGNLPKGMVLGGVVQIEISKTDGQITNVIHGK
jgi:hypothetical protein